MDNKQILIADDDKEVLDFYKDLFDEFNSLSGDLTDAGFSIKTFDDGIYLLQYFDGEYRQNNRIPLCILDMRMPVMDGLETAKKLRLIDSDIIIIVITAYSDDLSIKIIKKSLKDNIYFLRKPFSQEELYCLVDSLIKTWNKNVELYKYRFSLEELVKRRTCDLLSSNKKLKEEIAERIKIESVLSSTFDAIDDMIVVIDKNMQIVMSNWKTRQYMKEKNIYSNSFQALREFDELCKYWKVKEVFNSGKSMEFEYPSFIDGRTIEIRVYPVFDEKSAVVMIVEYLRDITDRKCAEEERIRLATAIEHLDESVAITDREGNLIYVNPAFEKMTGYEITEVAEKNFSILKSEHQDTSFYDDMWDKIKKGRVWYGNFINKKKNGTFYNVDASITPIIDDSGVITNFVSVQRDATDKIKLEKQLRQAQKMEALGTLAGGIAHDFNNILASILINTELAMGEVSETTKTWKNLDQVLTAANRAADLVKQILSFSRQREQELKPVQMSIIIKEALRLIRSTLPATIEIKHDIESSSMIKGDPSQIHQILMNLCTNAFHAMREKGGILEITLSDIQISPEDSGLYEVLETGSYVKLTVSDNGYGIDDSIKERIFEPYFTTKRVGEGTGLGLAVVHGIVQSYGGEIKVYSQKGKGTTFHIYLPKLETGEMKKNELSVSIAGGKEKIFFIDDEPLLVDGVKQALEKLGYEVFATVNSREALEIFKADPHKVDLIITDQAMPELPGHKLAQEVLQIKPDLPIIVCTGFSDTINKENYWSIGIREFVMKPFSMKSLAEVIRKVLEHNER